MRRRTCAPMERRLRTPCKRNYELAPSRFPSRPAPGEPPLVGVIGHRITPRQSGHPPAVGGKGSFARSPARTTLCSMQLLVGASLERAPGPKYTSELGYAELAPSGPLPKPATLRRWRESLPEGFDLALRAPDVCWNAPEGPLRLGPSLEERMRWLEDAADALKASMLVVATGATITTGARDRNRVRAYFGKLSLPETCRAVWHPTGLWEPAAVQAMARSMSILGGFDAIDDPVPDRETVYGLLRAEGLRRSFSHAQLLEVLDKLRATSVERAYLTIESPQCFREACLLRALAEGKA